MLKPILLPNHSQDGLASGQEGSEREEVCTGKHTVHGGQPGCPCAQGQGSLPIVTQHLTVIYTRGSRVGLGFLLEHS